VADFESKLRWLSERGTPVGAEELIERIEAELAGNPLVVVADRQEDTLTVGTQKRPDGNRPSRSRGFAWAVALVAMIIGVVGLNLVLTGNRNLVADDESLPTLATPEDGTMTDLRVIEAAVEALYSGNADRAAELFELPAPHGDDWIRTEAAYQAAIGGRLALDCNPLENPGLFSCLVPYQNAFTDAIGWVDSPGDIISVSVVDGVITEFGFPVHSFLERGLAAFLAYIREGNYERGFEHSIECAAVVMGHLDTWAAWAETNLEPPSWYTEGDMLEAGVEALYSGDGELAAGLFELDSPSCCGGLSGDDWIRETAQYQAAVGGGVSLDCVDEGTPGRFTCIVVYQNIFTRVIGWVDPPGETVSVAVADPLITEFNPTHRFIQDALRDFLAAQGDLQEEGVVFPPCSLSDPLGPSGWLTPGCTDFALTHLDDWIAWAEVNLALPPVAMPPVIEAGVEALYSGDADPAAELFELADRDDDEIRRLAAFEAAIEGRLALSCWDRGPGRFDCFANYQNALTDAIGSGRPPGDDFRAVVEDGVITEFYFPEHTYLMAAVANYLRVEGEPVCAREFFTEYPAAEGDAPPTTACVSVIMEKLDEWADWYESNGMD